MDSHLVESLVSLHGGFKVQTSEDFLGEVMVILRHLFPVFGEGVQILVNDNLAVMGDVFCGILPASEHLVLLICMISCPVSIMSIVPAEGGPFPSFRDTFELGDIICPGHPSMGFYAVQSSPFGLVFEKEGLFTEDIGKRMLSSSQEEILHSFIFPLVSDIKVAVVQVIGDLSHKANILLDIYLIFFTASWII
jgi:hypothetical protein